MWFSLYQFLEYVVLHVPPVRTKGKYGGMREDDGSRGDFEGLEHHGLGNVGEVDQHSHSVHFNHDFL